MPYLLRCTLCSFQDVAGDVGEVFDSIDAHQEDLGQDHFVNFEVVEEEPFLRGGDPDKDLHL